MRHFFPARPLSRGAALLLWGFSRIARRRLRRGFRAVRVLRPEQLKSLPAGPLVIYLNHPSWWDPLVCLLLARTLQPGRQHRAPISAASLREYRFFGNIGMFPVEQDSLRGAAQFLRASTAVLESGGVLWITAEGHFTDARVRPTRLKAGLGALLHRSGPVTVLPLALEYTFWNQRAPEVLAAFGEPFLVHSGRQHSTAEWTALLESRLQALQEELAAASLRRDESAFTTVLQGARGTSGVYGVWQRVRSGLRGTKHATDHEAGSKDSGRSAGGEQ